VVCGVLCGVVCLCMWLCVCVCVVYVYGVFVYKISRINFTQRNITSK